MTGWCVLLVPSVIMSLLASVFCMMVIEANAPSKLNQVELEEEVNASVWRKRKEDNGECNKCIAH